MTEITYDFDLEETLTVPEGAHGIIVNITITPNDAGCIVYGHDRNGDIQPVHITGSQKELELPFSQPKIWVKYLSGLRTFRISTVGGHRKPRSQGKKALGFFSGLVLVLLITPPPALGGHRRV